MGQVDADRGLLISMGMLVSCSNGGQEVAFNHQKPGGCNYLNYQKEQRGRQGNGSLRKLQRCLIEHGVCGGKAVWQPTSMLLNIHDPWAAGMKEQWALDCRCNKSYCPLLSFWTTASVHIQKRLTIVQAKSIGEKILASFLITETQYPMPET